MTNYNDGNWHGWNGGECPVHPETEVTITYPSGLTVVDAIANMLPWDGPFLFRVTKKYLEPEWKVPLEGVTYDRVQVKFIAGVLHVREVLDE